jgi:trk system potassium uptake protein TrkH
MRNRFERMGSVFHIQGYLLETLGVVIIIPLVVALLYWGQRGENLDTLLAFAVPSALSLAVGRALRKTLKPRALDMTGSILVCGLGWVIASAVGALPFVIGVKASFLDAYFEAMSGFTTTGITLFEGLDGMAHSILFWRAVTQWMGGIGILSFFLAVTFRGSGAHHIFGAESHKISSTRPAPGLFHTLKILWGIYALFTLASAAALSFEGMPLFDSICHAMTALSTGGFSPHDASIGYYAAGGYRHYRLIEYTVVVAMMLGGINFLVHYRVLTRDFRALWDNAEIRWWWRLVAGFTGLVMIDHLRTFGWDLNPGHIERVFRYSLFQVTSILTTTGFGTQDIASRYFPALAKQLFLVMMLIGGCVGSTGGGIKVMRVVLLGRLMLREIYKLRVSRSTSTRLLMDGRPVSDDESHRTAAIFFMWILLLAVGGGVTALLSKHGPLESVSGMFSALGNIGPCYISVGDMIAIHPLVKVTYIFGMLAGRLEILPVLLLFSRKAWRG